MSETQGGKRVQWLAEKNVAASFCLVFFFSSKKKHDLNDENLDATLR